MYITSIKYFHLDKEVLASLSRKTTSALWADKYKKIGGVRHGFIF